jgi:periplasmic protein TonB
MDRMLRKSFCVGLLLPGSMVFAQQHARINGAQALRFEQGSGFSNYVAFCVTPKESMAHVPPAKLPPDKLEYALCWYVNGTMSHGSAVSPEVEGRLVISPNHVRFVPSDSKSADTYVDLHPEKVEVKHDSGQPYGIVQANEVAFRFQFSKLCPSCPSGAAAPADGDAEIADKEFALLEENIRHFYSGWKQIYRLSSGKAAEPVSAKAPAASAQSVESRLSGASQQAVSPAPVDPGTASDPTSASRSTTAASAGPSPTAAASSKASSPGAKIRSVKIAAGTASGLLVKKVSPSYPLSAKLVRLEGTVVVRAVIEKTGDVAEVYALSGPPILESAAVDAVKQWQYRPYVQNGQPVDVETTIEVVFALDGSRPITRAANLAK